MALGCTSACRAAISFLRRYITSILWSLLMCFVFWTSYSKYKKEPKYFYLRQIIGSGLCLSRGMASVLNVCCFIVIVPMCRCVSACVQLLGTKLSPKLICRWGSFAQNVHITCGYIIVFASVFHSFAHIVNAWNFSRFYNLKLGEVNLAKSRGEVRQFQDPLLLVISTVPGVTGVLMIVVLCVLSSSSSKYMRFTNFDLFWISHHLFVIFFILLLCHPLSGILKEQNNVSNHPPLFCANHSVSPVASQSCTTRPTFIPQTTHTWKWIIAALLLYVTDIGYRIIRGFESVQVLSVQSFNCDLLSLTLQKQGFTARPGQFIFLKCPNISSIEWHPFSLSKCPTNADPSFTIHIRTKGDWSCQLKHEIHREMAKKRKCANISGNLFYPNSFRSVLKTKLGVDGPHGSSMENVLKHSVSICIAGGVGITPFASVLNFLRFWRFCQTEALAYIMDL